MQDQITTKTCSRCHVEKPLDAFAKSKSGRLGLRQCCRACWSLANKQRYAEQREHILAVNRAWREANPERMEGLREAWRQNHPEALRAIHLRWLNSHKEEERQRAARYHLANADANHARNKVWREAHKEERAQSFAQWRKANPDYFTEWNAANPDKVRDKSVRRRAQLRGQFLESVYLSVLIERDKRTCGICGKRIASGQESVDHILPVSKGGAHSYANTRLAHRLCNVRRNNRGTAQLRMMG